MDRVPKDKGFIISRNKGFQSEDNNDKNKVKVKLGILSDNAMSYYRNVSASLESGFDDNDPSIKDNFLSNVYQTLATEGVHVSQNQTVSRILELLFSHSQPRHMGELFCTFCSSLTIVTFDRFASHVFQSLVHYLPAIYEDSQVESHSNSQIKLAIEQLCKFMLSHLRDIITDTYASHVLRSLLEALSGVQVKEEVIRSRASRTHSKDKIDNVVVASIKSQSLVQDYQESFKALTDKIISLCNFEDHLQDPSYCPVLQTVLLILHKKSAQDYNSLVQTILKRAFVVPEYGKTDEFGTSNRLPDVVKNDVGSHLVELIISLTSADQLKQLYEQLFKGNLVHFTVHPIANYVLQKFLTMIADAAMMKEVVYDLTQYMEDILAINHVGVITKLAEACRKNQKGENHFIKALMAAFHCLEPEERQSKLVPLVASLQTYEIFFPEDAKEKTEESPTTASSSQALLKTVNIHGSLLLQQLLKFTKSKLVVSSFLQLSPVELVGLFCDKCGSHVVDAFFQSSSIPEAQKLAFLTRLKGLYTNIACNRNGSRCLESIWKESLLKSKILIAEELSKHLDRIESNQWGKFLCRNFALLKFAHRRKEWMEIQGANIKKQQILSDILQGKPRKRKNKKNTAGSNTKGLPAVPPDEKANLSLPPLETTSSHKQQKKRCVNEVDSDNATSNSSSTQTKSKKKKVINKSGNFDESLSSHGENNDQVTEGRIQKRKKTKNKNSQVMA